jgi:general secretion pathway protein L
MARTLGLDVGATAVRGVVVRTALRRTEVERYVEATVAPAESPAARAEARATAIREVVAACGRAPDAVVASLEGSDASVRPVDLPAAARKRIAEVLPFELEAMLPFPVETAVVDYQPVPDAAPGQIRVLAAASPRARVESLLAELRDAGVDPAEVAVGAAALEGLVALTPELGGEGPFLVVDLGASRTDLCIVSKGRCVLSRTVSAGVGGLPRSEPELARAVVQTLAAHRAAGGAPVARVLVCGGGALVDGMIAWLAERVEGAPVSALALPGAPGSEPATHPLFGRAAALAARVAQKAKRLDLRQGDLAYRRALGGLRQLAPLIAVCVSLVFFAFVFSTWASYRVLAARHVALEEELARATRRHFGEETRDPDRARRLLEGRVGPTDPLPRFDAFDVLDALSTAIEPGIVHDVRRLEIEIGAGERDGRLELQGAVASIAERDRIVAELEKHACIHDIEKGRTGPMPGSDRVQYQLEAVVRCGPSRRPAKNKNRNTRSTDR